MKERKYMPLIAALVTLLPMFVGLILWNKLPDTVPIHFNSMNEADGYAPKSFAVYWCPIIMLIFHCLIRLGVRGKGMSRKFGRLSIAMTWLCPVLSCMIGGLTYLEALGSNVNSNIIICSFVGAIFIIFGAYLPSIERNSMVGLKFGWTLANEGNWKFTHKVGRISFITAGVIFLLCGFYYKVWIVITAFAIAIVVPYIASFAFYKKYGDKNPYAAKEKAKKKAAPKPKKLN